MGGWTATRGNAKMQGTFLRQNLEGVLIAVGEKRIEGQPAGSGQMAHYRCYFLGADGRILGAAENIEATSDTEALAASRQLFAARPDSSGFELWRCKRRVHEETRKAACIT